MCHATKSNNRTRFSTHYPFSSTMSVKAAYSHISIALMINHETGEHFSLSLSFTLPLFPSLSLFLSGSFRKAYPREPPNRNTSLCAVENSPQVCCQTRTCSEKARIYIDRYSLAISFLLLIHFSLLFFTSAFQRDARKLLVSNSTSRTELRRTYKKSED